MGARKRIIAEIGEDRIEFNNYAEYLRWNKKRKMGRIDSGIYLKYLQEKKRYENEGKILEIIRNISLALLLSLLFLRYVVEPYYTTICLMR